MLDFLGTSTDVLVGFAIATTLILLWAAAFFDLTRRHDLSLVKKGAWAVAIILTAHIGIALYFAMRPIPPPYGKGGKHTVDRSSNLVKDLERLHEERESGVLSDDTYLAAKKELLGVAVGLDETS